MQRIATQKAQGCCQEIRVATEVRPTDAPDRAVGSVGNSLRALNPTVGGPMSSRTVLSTSCTCKIAIGAAIFNILHLHLSMFSAPQRPYPAVCRRSRQLAEGSSARIFASIIVTEDCSPASGPPFVKAVNVGVLEDIADPHIDPFARTRFTQAPRELGDEPLPLLHFGQVGHGTRRWRNSASLSRAGFATSRGRHGLPNSAALTWH